MAQKSDEVRKMAAVEKIFLKKLDRKREMYENISDMIVVSPQS